MDRIKTVVKGNRLIWNQVKIEVMRVAKDDTWADLYCTGPTGDTWTKRQALPLPEGTMFRD